MDNIKLLYEETHSLWNALRSLEPDQAKAFMKIISGQSSDKPVLQYYLGFIDGVSFSIHDICPTCSEKHDVDDMRPFEKALAKKASQTQENVTAAAQEAQKRVIASSIEDVSISGQYL